MRVSRRLNASPACLTGEELDYSPHIERLLARGGAPLQRRILELNPAHVIVREMRERLAQDAGDPLLPVFADLLLGSALLAEGSGLPAPAQFNARIIELLAHSVAREPTLATR